MARRYRFDDVEIDVEGFRLFKAGEIVAIEPKALNLLVFLVENRGRLIERRELIDAVWGEAFVTDHVLNRAVGQLRKALADDAKVPRYIETVPTLGYRFVANVEVDGDEGSKGPKEKAPEIAGSATRRRVSFRTLAGAGIAALALIASITGIWIKVRGRAVSASSIRSLAVLPLENLSGDPAQDYMADGMTSELITGLAQIRALRVISQTTAMQYKNARKPLPQIARELKVDAVIEGSLMRSNDQLRISAQLVDAQADRQLWAHTYDGDLRDVLALENQVASDVAERIQIQISEEERTELASTGQVDPRASEAYFAGEAASQPNTPEAWHSALPFFQQAVQIDPQFARAYVAVGRSYNFLGDWAPHLQPGTRIEAGEAIAGADSALAKALELDPELGEAYEERAWTAVKYRWDFQGAEEGFRRALEMEPGSPSAHDGLAYALVVQGRFDEALREAELAKELDPLSLVVNTDYCRWLIFARRNDLAVPQCEGALKLGPDYEFALSVIAELYERTSDFANGHKVLLQLGCDPRCRAMMDEIHGGPGVAGAFDAWLKTQKTPPQAFFMARAYAGLHKKDAAFNWLEKAYELRSDVPGMAFLGVDPDFDSLRSDPRFDAFLRHVGLPQQPHGLF